MCLVDAWMRQHIWAGLINKFTIASRQLFHLALAQLCVGFKHSGNANPSLFADSVCLCMYVAGTSATCCGHREGSGTCTP